MKYWILATAALVTVCGFAAASEAPVGQAEMSVTGMKIAMGPTSAPQKPGGTVDGAKDSSSKCSATGLCAKVHKRTKRPHKHS
jgi:hypothetical protein